MALLKRVWQAWKRIGQLIGDFIARMVLTVFYFTIVVPFGIGVRLLGDPLALRPLERGRQSYWGQREPLDEGVEAAGRLY